MLLFLLILSADDVSFAAAAIFLAVASCMSQRKKNPSPTLHGGRGIFVFVLCTWEKNEGFRAVDRKNTDGIHDNRQI